MHLRIVLFKQNFANKTERKKNFLASLQTSSSEVQSKSLLHFKPEALMWFIFVPSFGGCKPCHRESRCVIFSMWAAKISKPQGSLNFYG